MYPQRRQLSLIGLSAIAATLISIVNILRYLQTTPYDQQFGFGTHGILILLPGNLSLGLLNFPVILGTLFIYTTILKQSLSRLTLIGLYVFLLIIYTFINPLVLEPFRFGSFATPGVIPASIAAYAVVVYLASLVLQKRQSGSFGSQRV